MSMVQPRSENLEVPSEPAAAAAAPLAGGQAAAAALGDTAEPLADGPAGQGAARGGRSGR